MNPGATGTEEKRWRESSERKTVRRACELAGVPPIPPNTLGRHFFGTMVIEDGGDIYALKEWLGHSQISTTEGYTHVTAQKLGSLTRLRGRSKQ